MKKLLINSVFLVPLFVCPFLHAQIMDFTAPVQGINQQTRSIAPIVAATLMLIGLLGMLGNYLIGKKDFSESVYKVFGAVIIVSVVMFVYSWVSSIKF